MKIKEMFENLWKIKSINPKVKEEDKKSYYDFFLDGYGCALINLEDKESYEAFLKENEHAPKKSGITITGVKVVGLCSKCRKEGDEIPKYKDGRIVEDKDISCLTNAFGKCQVQDNNEIEWAKGQNKMTDSSVMVEVKSQKQGDTVQDKEVKGCGKEEMEADSIVVCGKDGLCNECQNPEKEEKGCGNVVGYDMGVSVLCNGKHRDEAERNIARTPVEKESKKELHKDYEN